MLTRHAYELLPTSKLANNINLNSTRNRRVFIVLVAFAFFAVLYEAVIHGHVEEVAPPTSNDEVKPRLEIPSSSSSSSNTDDDHDDLIPPRESTPSDQPLRKPDPTHETAPSSSLKSRVVSAAQEILAKTKKDVINLMLLDKGFIVMTKNWICNVRQFPGLLENLLILATDEESYEAMRGFSPVVVNESYSARLNVVKIPFTPRRKDPTQASSTFGTFAYFDLMLFRLDILTHLLTKGVGFFIMESDSVWLGDPISLLESTPGDIVAGYDGEKRKSPMAMVGFEYVRPTSSSVRAFQTLTVTMRRRLLQFLLHDSRTTGGARGKDGKLLTFPDHVPDVADVGNEQHVFSSIISRSKKLKVAWMDPTLFPNGKWFLNREGHPIVIQNNWITGESAKRARAKEFGFWYLHDDERRCNRVVVGWGGN